PAARSRRRTDTGRSRRTAPGARRCRPERRSPRAWPRPPPRRAARARRPRRAWPTRGARACAPPAAPRGSGFARRGPSSRFDRRALRALGRVAHLPALRGELVAQAVGLSEVPGGAGRFAAFEQRTRRLVGPSVGLASVEEVVEREDREHLAQVGVPRAG